MATAKKLVYTRKCICGCSTFETGRAKAVFAPHHPPEERSKLRARILKCEISSGLIPPDEWRMCEICGEYFPYYHILHSTHKHMASCPKFLYKDCNKKLRAIRARDSKKKGKRYFTDQKDFRGTICRPDGKECENYSTCSDREFAPDPDKRLWDYELVGQGCYRAPKRSLRTSTGAGVLSGVWSIEIKMR